MSFENFLKMRIARVCSGDNRAQSQTIIFKIQTFYKFGFTNYAFAFMVVPIEK